MDEETNELTDLGICLSALSLEPREQFGRVCIFNISTFAFLMLLRSLLGFIN